MKIYTIRDRFGLWLGCLTSVLGIGVSIYMYPAGVGASVFVLVALGIVSALMIYNGTQTKTFSETGICVKTFLKTTSVSWSQIEKVGAAWINLGGQVNRYISVTWPGEPEKKHWVYRWLWFMKLENQEGFLFPYSDELRDVVTQYYGPLDFDLSRGKPM